MTFATANFVAAGAQSTRGKGPQVFTYTTSDALTDIDTSGYFNSVSDRLEVGDLIHTVVTTSGVPTGYGLFIVQSNTGGVVDVFDAINSPTSLSDAD